MSLSVVIDSARYRDQLNRFIEEFGADQQELLKEEMRLLLRDIIRLTPPNSQQQGRNAIRGDLFGGKKAGRYSSIGLFQRIGSSTLVPPKNKGAEGDTVGVRLGWEGSKKIRIYRRFWKPNASTDEMASFHKRYQNPRTGRTGNISQSVIGRQRVQDQMWVSDSAANRYFKMLADRVGLAKAGWLAAARGVGLKLPNWVERHAGYAKGGYVPPRPSEMSITAINRSSKIPNYEQRHVWPAIAGRAKSLASELARLAGGGKSRRKSLANTPSGQAAE